MKKKSVLLLKKSLVLMGLMSILVLISVPVTAGTLAVSNSNDASYSGLSSAFLNGYSSSGLTLPASPSLGFSSLLSGFPGSSSFGTGTGTLLPGGGTSSGTLSLISSALNNYKSSPIAFKDYSSIASYMPTCYGV